MKTTHTPGPWKLEPAAPNGWHITCEILTRKSLVGYTYSHTGQKEMDDANARLIASAPELLEALRLALTCLDAMADGRALDVVDIVGDAATQAAAALARAEGE